MLRFFKNWTLPIAMVAGTLGYFIFANFQFLQPTKPYIHSFVSFITPVLIFAQLLLTFCKIEFKELKPSPWHAWLLVFQAIATLLVAGVLILFPVGSPYKEIFEGALVCLVCPTATAAAVITSKLGGSASSLTTYTLLSNILAAIMVPLIFPLVEVHVGSTFLTAFLRILGKVFPLLLLPFIMAFFFRFFMPMVHRVLVKQKDLAFYIWSLALAIVTAQTVRSLVQSTVESYVQVALCVMGLVTCALQFFVGKSIGSRYSDTISAGQALGQKNTVLAIWMAYTYLNPISSVAPGSYVLWQNIFNSWQLWRKRKEEAQ
jgi:BASS family bile acid:Na+ symporter